jgi:hypothetical protein
MISQTASLASTLRAIAFDSLCCGSAADCADFADEERVSTIRVIREIRGKDKP